MNNSGKHIAHWSNTDVQKYLNGELSAREMHDLEQQALDDPFLADALEGLQTQPGETIRVDLAELRGRLDTRVAKKPAAIPWGAIRVAAAVILLVGLGLTAYYTQRDHGRSANLTKAKAPAPSPAANQVTAPATTTIPPSLPAPPAVAKSAAPPATTNPAASEADSARTRPQSGLIGSRSIASSDENTIARSAQPAADKAPPAEVQQFSDSLASITADIAKDTAHAVASGYPKESRERTLAAGANPHLVAISGRVLDLNNHPLAGAYLTYRSKGTVTGAVTDEKGQFNLYIPQKDTTRRLTVDMAGYQQTQYALSTNEQSGNTIYLRQDPAQLSEVVVSGIGAKRKEFLTETVSDKPEKLDSFWLNTAPAMGRIAYLNYLAAARKTVPVDTTIHGTESISFRVDKKGALTEFRIERSLSPAHDAGVIRMITEGPPWKMLYGRSARALVDVTF